MTTLSTARRLVVPATVPPAAWSMVRSLSAERDIPVVESPVVGGTVISRPSTGDVLVHPVPDVFGRALEAPNGWTVLRIVDHAVDAGPDAIGYGRPTNSTAAELSSRLRALWKPLRQQRGVRSILSAPAEFGLAFIAPSGIGLPEDVTSTSVWWPGLPDLVVVHHPEVSAWDAYDGPID